MLHGKLKRIALIGLCAGGVLAAAYVGLAAWSMHDDIGVAILAITTDDSYPGIPKPLAEAYLRYGHYDPNSLLPRRGPPAFYFICAGYGMVNTQNGKVLELSSLLAHRGADVNAAFDGLTSLHGAIIANEPGLVRHLLALGADSRVRVMPSGKPYDGMTALELARYFSSRKNRDLREVIAILEQVQHNRPMQPTAASGG